MTIFRMYAENGNRAGFWVQHRIWRNTCALIVSIDGQRFGPLPGTSLRPGIAPVQVRWFDIRSGRMVAPPTPLDQAMELADPTDINFAFIAAPAWSHRIVSEAVTNDPAMAIGN